MISCGIKHSFFIQKNCCKKHYFCNHLKEEGEPLVEGDGAVAVLVHLLEQTHLLLGGLEGGGESESKTGIITNC